MVRRAPALAGAAVLAAVLLATGCSDSPAPVDPENPELADPRAEQEAAAEAPMRRGLWVLAEGSHQTLDSPERITRLVERASALGVGDLFVQVYRRDRSWFPSTHADDSPYRAIHERSGSDPLVELIREAHAHGLRVHAWANLLSVHGNRGAQVLAKSGRDAVLVDRQGRSLLDYPAMEVPEPDRRHTRMGSPGLWLDAGHPGVVAHLESVIDDLVAAAPELDGLHLDYVRHPLALPIPPGSRFLGLDFGYGTGRIAEFEQLSGGAFRRGEAWDAYRRGRVTELVRRVGARLPETWEYSAAVLPWADRAYLSAMQDWRGWLDGGLIDFAVAMAYTRDDTLLRYLSHGLVGGLGGDRVWLGLGSWLFLKDPQQHATQIATAESVGPPGVALFSYDSLVDAEGALDSLPWQAH